MEATRGATNDEVLGCYARGIEACERRLREAEEMDETIIASTGDESPYGPGKAIGESLRSMSKAMVAYRMGCLEDNIRSFSGFAVTHCGARNQEDVRELAAKFGASIGRTDFHEAAIVRGCESAMGLHLIDREAT